VQNTHIVTGLPRQFEIIFLAFLLEPLLAQQGTTAPAQSPNENPTRYVRNGLIGTANGAVTVIALGEPKAEEKSHSRWPNQIKLLGSSRIDAAWYSLPSSFQRE
jgi:hypothetical protein